MNRRTAIKTVIVAGTALAGAAACGTDVRPTAASPPVSQPSPTTSPAKLPSVLPAALPPEVTHGPRDRPAVALTFHGQGDPVLVTRLLSELESGGAQVTVMAVGTWLAQFPAIAQRVLAGGHELGNHTEHHGAIAQMSAAAAYREIDDCANTLRRLTGSAGTWFRPSQTQHATATIRAQARRAGYPTCLSYDVDALDYTDPPAATVVRDTLGPIRGGSIVSMHCGHPVTISAIGPILDGLRARGLRAVTMTELVRP